MDPLVARKYNNDVRAWTLKYAILPWASSVKARDNVVQVHDAAAAQAKQEREREQERGREEGVDTQPQAALPPLHELVLVTGCWRQTAKVHLLIHAVEIVKATEGAVLGLLGTVDRSGLTSALEKVREVLKTRGFLL